MHNPTPNLHFRLWVFVSASLQNMNHLHHYNAEYTIYNSPFHAYHK